MILGIDEVGRGPWAGPLVVGAVVLGGTEIEGLTDSKKLTKKRREELNQQILSEASGVGLGWVDANEIDKIGLGPALKLATIRAVSLIKVPYHEIIIDGTINFLEDTTKGQFVSTMKKADLLIPSVSAASIVAKVARDNFMSEQDDIYPQYGFGSHVGYGTKRHREAIGQFGVTSLHRLSFSPLQKYRTAATVEPVQVKKSTAIKTTKQVGDDAETVVANELKRRGHQVIHRNWRTRFCEIDIVSESQGKIFFTEVKYRKESSRGGGLEAITPYKLRQIRFAVEVFLAFNNRYRRADIGLVGASVSGTPATIDEIIEIID